MVEGAKEGQVEYRVEDVERRDGERRRQKKGKLKKKKKKKKVEGGGAMGQRQEP